MQNPLLKFRQSSITSEKLGYLSEKLKTPIPNTLLLTLVSKRVQNLNKNY